MGDEIEVPTVHGKVKLKIPAGTQTGTKFPPERQRGSSPARNRERRPARRVTVVTPKNLNEKQREAIRAFAAAGGDTLVEDEANFFDKSKGRLQN